MPDFSELIITTDVENARSLLIQIRYGLETKPEYAAQRALAWMQGILHQALSQAGKEWE